MKNIIWDWNGTLLDDLALCNDILNIMLKKRGVAEVSREKYLDIFTFPIIDYYRRAGFDFAKEPYPVLADEFMVLYDRMEPTAGLFPHVRETLEAFHQAGMKQFILSTTRETELLKQVAARGIDGYFEKICGTGTILAHGKRDIALRWAEEHREELKESVFIGDTLHDGEMAALMGIPCIFVSCGHNSKERLRKTGLLTVDDHRELREIIG